MIVIVAAAIGVVYGALLARRRGGKGLDMAQYAAGYGIALALLALFASLGLEKLVFD